MRNFICIILLGFSWLAALPVAANEDITCYPKTDDRDNDGYAKAGSIAKDFSVPDASQYTCPSGYVPDDDDCDDTRSSVHPYRSEVAFNGRDDNCNGEADENEYVYFSNGYDNNNDFFKIQVKLNNKDVLDHYDAGDDIYAKVRYRKITETEDQDQYSDYQKVRFYDDEHDYLGKYKAATITLTGLSKTTVYRSRVKFYYKSGSSYQEIGIYGPLLYYTSTTNTAADQATSQARTGVLLRAFKEYFYQRIGLVGRNGSQWENGTRYKADSQESWCTEFYSWVSQWNIKDIYPITDTVPMRKYFTDRNSFSRVYTLSDLDDASRGDWLTFDFNDNGKTDHSAMLLGIRSDGTIMTIEGNTSNRVRVRERDVNDVYGYGHLKSSMVKE